MDHLNYVQLMDCDDEYFSVLAISGQLENGAASQRAFGIFNVSIGDELTVFKIKASFL